MSGGTVSRGRVQGDNVQGGQCPGGQCPGGQGPGGVSRGTVSTGRVQGECSGRTVSRGHVQGGQCLGEGVQGTVSRGHVQGECSGGTVSRGHRAGHSPAGKASPPARIKPVRSPRRLAVDRTCPQSPQMRPTPSVAACVTCLWRLIKVTGGDEGETVSQQPCFCKKRPRALASPHQLPLWTENKKRSWEHSLPVAVHKPETELEGKNRCRLGAGCGVWALQCELTDTASLLLFDRSSPGRGHPHRSWSGGLAAAQSLFLGSGIAPYLGCFLPPAPVHCGQEQTPLQRAHPYTFTLRLCLG